MTIERRIADLLNGLPADHARDALAACCGSRRWVDAMVAARPFDDDGAVHRAAKDVWWRLDPEDWLEAFACHPRIGERRPAGPHGDWSGREQSGMARATDDVRRAMARLNREYEQRFGHMFLICATGKGAAEMLEALRRRMGNDPADELQVAAGEQAKITRLRLEQLVQP